MFVLYKENFKKKNHTITQNMLFGVKGHDNCKEEEKNTGTLSPENNKKPLILHC